MFVLGGAAVTFLVECLCEQRVKRRRDEKLKCRMRASSRSNGGTGGLDLLHHRAQARIDILAPAAALHVAADDLVQFVVARDVCGRHAQAFGEFRSRAPA